MRSAAAAGPRPRRGSARRPVRPAAAGVDARSARGRSPPAWRLPNGSAPAGRAATSRRSSRSSMSSRRSRAAFRLPPDARQREAMRQEAGAGQRMRADKDVVARRHAAKQGEVLECAADAEGRPPMARQRGDRLRLQQDFATLRAAEAADAVEQGGLAGAVRTDKSAHLVVGDGERHAVQRGDPAKSHLHAAHVEQTGRFPPSTSHAAGSPPDAAVSRRLPPVCMR